MAPELLEIEPRELNFTFELKKQSSCSARLVNRSNEYVAFKVKTTNPKRYCVRPNTGIVLPRATCDFTVTMQAHRVAPPDMQLKDKFLVQSTLVPFGTTDEEIVPSFFSKENGRYIEEHKLRVILSSPCSPVPQTIGEVPKQETSYETSISKETMTSKVEALNGVEDNESLIRSEYLHQSHVAKDLEDLNLKLNNLEMKLKEMKRIFQADETITTLREEQSVVIQERDKLHKEIILLGRKCTTRIQVGFPFWFVVFIALVGVAIGHFFLP